MLKDSAAIFRELIKNRDFSFIVLCFSLLILPLSINLSSIFFVVSVVLKLTTVLLKKQKLLYNITLKQSALIGALFFLYIVLNSLMQSGLELTIAFFEIEYSKFALLFIVPFLIKSKKQNKVLLHCLILGSFISIFMSFFYSVTHNTNFDSDIFIQLFDIHHTYLALFVLTTINWITPKLLIRDIEPRIKFLILILILFYAYVLYALESKVSVVIMALLILLHFFWRAPSKKIIKTISLITIIGFLVLFNSKLKVGYDNALDFRIQLWDAAINNIQDHAFFGNLVYPEKTLLNYQHYLSGKYYLLDSNLNTHNQYLSLIMRFGIIGFLLFTSLLILLVRRVNLRKTQNTTTEMLGFLLIVFLVFYTENILDRHHGIVWFSVFFNYYLLLVSDE